MNPHNERGQLQELENRLEQERNLRMGLKANMELQAGKIQKLLHDNEELGADKAAALEQLARIQDCLNADPSNLEEKLEELRRWQELAQRKLGPTLESAEHQADILWSYVNAMGSPGHRLTIRLGTIAEKTWIGRKLKRVAAWLLALRRA